MRLATISGRAAIAHEDGFVDLNDASGGRFPAQTLACLQQWTHVLDWHSTARVVGRPSHPAPEDLDAPVPNPRQVFAAGLNYADHAAEMKMGASALSVFTKFPTCITGPVGALVLPHDEVDWEVELVVILGAELYDATPREAAAAVAGFAVGQDFSDRGLQMLAEPPQFSLAKSRPGFGPVGPTLTSVDEIDDVSALTISCTVNGETVQSSTTAEMIRAPYQLVSEISQTCRLLPGDLVFTGTPSGVGVGRTPPRYLAPGDEVRSTIEGLGTLVQRCVAGPRVEGR